MRRSILSGLILINCLFTVSALAQLNRSNQAVNITTNIYQNSSHAITGMTLQQVMLNQNNSYVNILSDTNLLDVRNFSPYAVYTPGMGCFHSDTLYMNIANAHGSWNSTQWQAITGTSVGCFIACSDTGKSVVTYHALDSAYNSHCFIACSDTGKSVVSYHALDSAFDSHCFIKCSDTGTSVATMYTVLTDISEETASLIPFADTSSLVVTHHEASVASAALVKYSDTASSTGGGTDASPKIATPYSVAEAISPFIPFSDTTSVIATHSQVAAASGAIQLLSKSTINLDTTADQPITLSGGTTFIITDILITNASAAPANADDGEWWNGPERSGIPYAITVGGYTPFETLITPDYYINTFSNTYFHPAQMITFVVFGGGQSLPAIGNTIYFSLGFQEGSPLTCTMYIYGYILN